MTQVHFTRAGHGETRFPPGPISGGPVFRRARFPTGPFFRAGNVFTDQPIFRLPGSPTLAG